MKIKPVLKTFMLAAVSACMVLLTGSCKDGPGDEDATVFGIVSGTVTDDLGSAIEGVAVSIKDVEGVMATSDADGKYVLEDVPVATQVIIFEKEGFQMTSVTLPVKMFSSDNSAVVDCSMNYANASITGRVLDGVNGDVPFEGVSVTLNDSKGTVVLTDADGLYSFENLSIKDYILTFSADGYISSSVSVTEDMFSHEDMTAHVPDVQLYQTQLLPGLTISDLKNADKWYYNEYRGGSNGEQYPRWDWSTCFMGALNFSGSWQEIGEGTDIMSANDDNIPVDLDNFESFVWGSKFISEDNNVMTVRYRTFADRDGATEWGVQVIDLSAAEPSVVKVGGNVSSENTSYEDTHFDLSSYIGKEVIIALGVYKSEKGKEKHLAIRRINFTSEPMSGWDWIYGTDVPGLEGWHLTQEMVRSTMVQEGVSFSGITLATDTGNRKEAYQSWRQNNHIGAEWSFMALTKDTEIFASQGAIIKTRGGDGVVNTLIPESYFYAKFNITSSNDEIVLRIRNGFGRSEWTFFKLTAVTEDGSVTHLQPVDYKSQGGAEAAADGCWKFFNDAGEPTSPDDYAMFRYDLSGFSGENVILVLGVFKGEQNDAESKISIYSINLE